MGSPLATLCSTVLFFLGSAIPSLGQGDIPALVKQMEPSIVVILTYDKEGKILGQGSGFFLNEGGDVITNHHVLQGVSHAVVKTMDGSVYPVKEVLSEDPEGDLIQISVGLPPHSAKPLRISTSFPEVGEHVIVIGTPFGLEKTVSDGIVSAIRTIPSFGKIIQVTAPISKGSSGSPVVNMKGEVIGVATFFIGAGQSLNFAIPSDRIARLTPGERKNLSAREKERVDQWLASAEGLYTTGLRHLWGEDCEKALPYFVKATEKNPNHAEAFFQTGYCKGKLGRYQESIEPYRQAIRIKPEDADVHNNLCAAYGVLGQYGEAIVSCQEAIRLSPDFAEAHNNLGWSYHQLGRYPEAIASCKQAIRINPEFAMAHYNLGNNYSALKQYPKAIESYKQVIRINFDYAEGHMNLGAAYHQEGRHEEAIASYRQAIRLKPDLAEAHFNLGVSYLRGGDRGGALDAYKTLKALDKELGNRLFHLIYE